jgi:hypothetical protein
VSNPSVNENLAYPAPIILVSHSEETDPEHEIVVGRIRQSGLSIAPRLILKVLLDRHSVAKCRCRVLQHEFTQVDTEEVASELDSYLFVQQWLFGHLPWILS